MSNISTLPVAQSTDAAAIMERVLLLGDLSKLTTPERTSFYMATCSSLGLNPLTRPFDYIKLSGREVLYAKRDCADQLRKINRISLEITDRKITGDLMVVTVRATTPDGRMDEDMGVVTVKGLQGEALANAMLKATTKAKRRVTLSICGLGMLDESEIRSAVEAEALAGPVDLAPRQRAIAAPAVIPPPKAEKPPLEVALGGGWEPAKFPRGKKGLREALEFMTGAVLDGKPEVVSLNNQLLDQIAEHIPELAEEISELRASAADAMAPKDDHEPGALGPEDRDEFGLPPLDRPAEEVLPTDPPD
jgi:hypothetical protein